MTTNPGLRDHITSAILDAATTVLSEHGDAASMAEVAEAAGVGRATLYRYFPSRDDLMRALIKAALDDAHHRVVEADLESVPVPEAIARLTRALVASGTKFGVLMNDRIHIDPKEVDRQLGKPARSVFHRGVADGTLRDDLTPELLSDLFGGLLHGALRMTVQNHIGIERTSAIVTAMFLDGARATSPV